MLSYTGTALLTDGHMSQSPSIMECSPTRLGEGWPDEAIVAVPVNYGMLSYRRRYQQQSQAIVAVPVNYGMLSYPFKSKNMQTKHVAVPVNYGMLSYLSLTKGLKSTVLSQSPSIMECSPTFASVVPRFLWSRRSPRQLWNALLRKSIYDNFWNGWVAVPVNYGMLSYNNNWKNEFIYACRSPRQLWNALLPKT